MVSMTTVLHAKIKAVKGGRWELDQMHFVEQC